MLLRTSKSPHPNSRSEWATLSPHPHSRSEWATLRRCTRRGAVAVEMAFVYGITFLLMAFLIVGALGVSRYQQLTALARESTRWASVRGAQYQKETGNAMAGPQDVYNQVIVPQAVLLDLSQLKYTVTWDDPSELPTYLDSNGNTKTNRVRVTLTYQWWPEMFLGGMTLTTTSEMTMSY